MKLIKKPLMAASLCVIPNCHTSASTNADSFLSHRSENVLKLLAMLKRWRNRICRIFATRINAELTFNKTSAVTGWAPLVKATSHSETANPANPDSPQHSHRDAAYLKNRSILCVGGRLTLYADYERLVANCGGCFLAFHGDADDSLDRLPLLLEMTDMIICPVDCVNHEAFLMVKRFCKHTQKPCVLLDRSEVRTFNAGIHALAKAGDEMSGNRNP
ncbi:DUF2325 domain-containing protein [Nitrosomonas sp. wSCUT-2]